MTTAKLTIPDLHRISADLLPHVDKLRIGRLCLDFGSIDLDVHVSASPVNAAAALLAAYDMWDDPRVRVTPHGTTRQLYVKATYRGAPIEHCKIYHDEASISRIDADPAPGRDLLAALAGEGPSPVEVRDEVWAACDGPSKPKPHVSAHMHGDWDHAGKCTAASGCDYHRPAVVEDDTAKVRREMIALSVYDHHEITTVTLAGRHEPVCSCEHWHSPMSYCDETEAVLAGYKHRDAELARELRDAGLAADTAEVNAR